MVQKLHSAPDRVFRCRVVGTCAFTAKDFEKLINHEYADHSDEEEEDEEGDEEVEEEQWEEIPEEARGGGSAGPPQHGQAPAAGAGAVVDDGA